MKSPCLAVITAFFLLSQFVALSQDARSFKIIKTFHIKSGGGWDYLAIDPGSNHLYVSHGTQVNILDKSTGDSLGVIPNTTGVHGIAFDNALNRGFISNGRLNTVTVFDLKNFAVIAQVPTGENPDAILFEPFSKKVVTCNGRSNDLSVIDPIRQSVIATVAVGGKLETAVSDGKGKLYVNIEDKGEIVVVNMSTFTVEARWSIAPGEEPTGLALDKKTNLLFSGCGNKWLMAVEAGTGKIVSKLPIGAGCDGVALDEEKRMVFTSNGEGTLSVFQVNSATDIKAIATVPTKRGARTIALDSGSHLVYLPTADFEAPKDQSAGAPRQRPVMIPGTFQVLVIGG